MITIPDLEGNVPLHLAVHGGEIKAVELCLRNGALISTQQHDSSTPVHLACSQGSYDIVKLMFTLQPQEVSGGGVLWELWVVVYIIDVFLSANSV
ncbi:Transient receptor potential cation channel subfamily A member 1 [Portunus trituberculatus]|uniref:Transient receptor potential cation channel subfamily A member 1 n=1 Tax=Portunus trituberculatus TaxID=210409 RepID=A0A5B7E755_PORTR|nr:Transient receptor potential cation channel subfamily A member 1 [Portunus trituberculatus]